MKKVLMVEWHITKNCNLNCPFCYINYKAQGEDLSAEDCKELLTQMYGMNIPGIIFSGGEPLLRKDLLLELLSQCKKFDIITVLATNGLLLNSKILDELVGAGLKFVGLSIDGADANSHDEIRGVKGSFDAVLEAIKICNERGVPVQVQTCASKKNYKEVPAILALCQKLGVRKYLVLDFVPTGRGNEIKDMALSSNEREQLLDFTYYASILLKDVLDVSYIEPYWIRKISQHDPAKGYEMKSKYTQGGVCYGGNSFFSIFPNGDVFPCPRLPISAGNVREIPLKEIWNNSRILSNLRDMNNLKGNCINCSVKEMCDGCRGRAYYLHDDYLESDPSCIFNCSEVRE